ncbi:MAG: nitroreductase family protein [Alphaproteobacteria bacterium]|nr:nitroreductase family protein [Alphaproteobacteria bacterium]
MPDHVPYTPPRYDDDEMIQRARCFAEFVDGRRTVRSFSTEPVPEEVIRDVIRAASTAPNGAHRQPWHFVAVSDPDLKARIREAAEAEERRNYDSRFPDEWLKALEPFATNAHKPYLEDAPWLIVVFAQLRGPAGKNYYVSESVGIAVGVLITAIHNAGLVSVTHTPSPMNFLKTLLDRPKGERAYLLLAVGHPAPGVTVPDLTRKPLDEVLTVLR